MPSFVLADIEHEIHLDAFRQEGPGWSVTKRTLRGGRRDGVEIIEVDNGDLAFTVVPTRGMGIWRGSFRGDRLGWTSPVVDGPVHPKFVDLNAWGGLGWLDGFDEWLVRCGLESNGPPFRDGDRTYNLHGRIANLPASQVVVHIDEDGPGTIVVEGIVDESRLFGPNFRLKTTISTAIGSNRLVVRDAITNRKDQPIPLELLYHWNFGPPYLEAGARFLAPAKTIVPKTPEAAAALGRFDVYEGPRPGFAEEVYLFELIGDGPEGRTVVLLRDQGGGRGVAMRFATSQLPVFTLWKNTGGTTDGYVTGLEPGLNYPNPRPYEASRGRLPTLAPGGTYVAETTLEFLDTTEGVAAVAGEIADLQGRAAPRVYPAPDEPFTAVSY